MVTSVNSDETLVMSVNVVDNLTVNVNAIITLLAGAELNCEIGDQSTPLHLQMSLLIFLLHENYPVTVVVNIDAPLT